MVLGWPDPYCRSQASKQATINGSQGGVDAGYAIPPRKGHALMALEDLLNNPAHHAVLSAAFDGLRNGTPVGQGS